MGGNSISRSRVRTPPTTPATDPSRAKLDKLLAELTALSPQERGQAIGALKAAGLPELADALEAVSPRGSRPPERPAPTYTPPA